MEEEPVLTNALFAWAVGITNRIARRYVDGIKRWHAEAATLSVMPNDNDQRLTQSSRVEAKTRANKARGATTKDGTGKAEVRTREARTIQSNHQHTRSTKAHH